MTPLAPRPGPLGQSRALPAWVVLSLLVACVGKPGPTPPEAPEPPPQQATSTAANGADPSGAAPSAAMPPPPHQDGPLSNADDLGRAPRQQLAARSAPVALTSADGQGMELRRYSARAVIDGPLSHCELRLTFHNPERRRREGRFELTLPDKATIARFAMKTGDRWMEGEVVEKQRARTIYEDFLHRKQDPALLEQESGNRFSARVFPIEADADKEIIVAWSAERTDPTATWTLPLVGLPELAELDVRVFVQGDGSDAAPAGTLGAVVGNRKEVRVHREHIQPAVDLEIRPGVLDAGWAAVRAGKVAVVRVDAGLLDPSGDDDRRDAPLGDVIALVDTSASGALAFETRLRQLEHLAKRVERDHGRLRIVAFDQGVASIWQGEAGRFGAEALDAFRRRGALGATDLAAALRAAKAEATALGAPSRVVLLSDGVATAGERDGSRLADLVHELEGAKVERLDAITSTAARDEALLARLVGGNLRNDGVVIHAGIEPDAVERLGRRTLAPIEVKVVGAAWTWPDRIVGLEADGSALVWAEIEQGDGPIEVLVSGGANGTLRPLARRGDERLLERAWARARVELLQAEHDRGEPAIREAIQRKVVELSLQHRVVSRWTSLLVLETDADYARYGISRTDRAAILTIGEDGATSLAARDEADQPAVKSGNKDLLEALGQPTDRRPAAAAPAPDPDRVEQRREQPEIEEAQGAAGADGAMANRAAGAEDRAAPAPTGNAAPPPAPEPSAAEEGEASREEAKPSEAKKVVVNEAAADDAARPVGAAPSAAPKAMKRAEAVMLDLDEAEAPRADVGDSIGGVGALRGGGSGGGGSATRGVARRPDTTFDRRMPPGAIAPHPGQQLVRHRVLSVRGVGQSAVDQALYRFAPALRSCAQMTSAYGLVQIEFSFGSDGRAQLGRILQQAGLGGDVARCVVQRAQRYLRVSTGGGLGQARVEFTFTGSRGHQVEPRPTPRPVRTGHRDELLEIQREVKRKPALRGILAQVDGLLVRAGRGGKGDAAKVRTGALAPAKGDDGDAPEAPLDEALRLARAHVASNAADLLGYVALGKALTAAGDLETSARAYGSLIDLHPGRADIRRFAGNLLESLELEPARALALDDYAAAVEDRKDHPTGWLMRALAEARAGQYLTAATTLDQGLHAPRRSGNFPAWERTARELLAVIGAAALGPDAKDFDAGKDVDGVGAILRRNGVQPDVRAGTRLLLTWENDANDVDLHVFDGRDDHAFYRRKRAAGGEIFADVTTGWGPECFSTRDPRAKLRVFVHSYRQGPMGFGMGRVLVLHSDGKGHVRFGDKPFVVMDDRAYVDLGVISASM